MSISKSIDLSAIKAGHLIVNEIFYSIQGESSYAGYLCVFIRLSFCNLRCSYCDTKYAYNEGKEISIDEIIYSVNEYKCNLVEITGGEPLLQKNIHQLISRLCDSGKNVLLETNGSIDINCIDSRVKRIVDFKCPSSEMDSNNLWQNIEHLKSDDEVKFVIGNREDYNWAKQKISEYNIDKKCLTLFSPVYGILEPVKLAQWIIDDNLNVKMQLQLHKYIWNPGKRGV